MTREVVTFSIQPEDRAMLDEVTGVEPGARSRWLRRMIKLAHERRQSRRKATTPERKQKR